MTQTPDEFSERTPEDVEVDLGDAPVEHVDDTSGINLDFADFSMPESESDMDLNLELAEPEAEQAESESGTEERVEEDEAIAKALEELGAQLRSKPGDWYVVHTYSGMENRVKQNIDSRVKTLNMEDYIYETVVPTEDAVEIRNGQKKNVTRTFMPGYVLVRMDLTDESWSAVRHTPSVTGFVGHADAPVPLDLAEVERLLTPSVVAKVVASGQAKSTRARKKVEVMDFHVGDSVMVTDGPFAGVHATIIEINLHNQRVKANVEILGRETPVDLTFPQIEKVVG